MIGTAMSAFAPHPDRDTIIRHLAWLCAPALEHNVIRLEIAWGAPAHGPRYAKTFFVSCLAAAADFACWINKQENNVYVSATLKRPDTPEKGRTMAHHALMATCLPMDIDVNFGVVADRFFSVAKPQLLVVTGSKPATRGQLFARIEPTTDLAAWEQLHAMIVKHCGGDESALGRNRLMRLGGTVSYPSPAKSARGYVKERTLVHFMDAPQYSMPSLQASIPAGIRSSAATAQQPIPTFPPARSRAIMPPIRAVEAALRTLPNSYADERHLWIKVGFALHDFDPGRIGLNLWQTFSQRCAGKAQATDFQKLWQSFVRPDIKRRLTIDWLLCEARQHVRNVNGTRL